MLNINFIISNWGDAHQMTRAISFEQNYGKVNYFTYIRNYYPSAYDKIQKKTIGKLENGKYFSRIFTYFYAFFFFLLKVPKSKNDLYYIYGMDNFLLFKLACVITFSSPKIIYEIDDIRKSLYEKSITAWFLTQLDTFLLLSADLVVVTSEAFITDFYELTHKELNKNYFLLENKIHDNFVQHTERLDFKVFENDSKEKIVLGYFGLIRCPRTLDILIKFAEDRKDIAIIIRGYFMDSTKVYLEKIKNIENISYLGTYVSPLDLAYMYKEINVSWICYPYNSNSFSNFSWARTNRYYEAGFYKTPIISAKGTQDAIQVLKYGIGISLDLSDVDNAVKTLNELTPEKILAFKKKLLSTDEKLFRVTDDYQKLFKAIDNLL